MIEAFMHFLLSSLLVKDLSFKFQILTGLVTQSGEGLGQSETISEGVGGKLILADQRYFNRLLKFIHEPSIRVICGHCALHVNQRI
jgi:hypothetical protein